MSRSFQDGKLHSIIKTQPHSAQQNFRPSYTAKADDHLYHNYSSVYIIGHNYHGHYLTNFSANFSGISDLRLVDNCLKMTEYDVIGGNESKTVILDT